MSLTNYLDARRMFSKKFGFYPVKVPVYGFVDKDYLDFQEKPKEIIW